MTHQNYADSRWGIGPRRASFPRFGRSLILLLLAVLANAIPAEAALPAVAPRSLGVVVERVEADYIRQTPRAVVVIGVSSPHGRGVWGSVRLAIFMPCSCELMPIAVKMMLSNLRCVQNRRPSRLLDASRIRMMLREFPLSAGRGRITVERPIANWAASAMGGKHS